MQVTQKGTQKTGSANSKGASRTGEGVKMSEVTERPREIATKACPVGWDCYVKGS